MWSFPEIPKINVTPEYPLKKYPEICIFIFQGTQELASGLWWLPMVWMAFPVLLAVAARALLPAVRLLSGRHKREQWQAASFSGLQGCSSGVLWLLVVADVPVPPPTNKHKHNHTHYHEICTLSNVKPKTKDIVRVALRSRNLKVTCLSALHPHRGTNSFPWHFILDSPVFFYRVILAVPFSADFRIRNVAPNLQAWHAAGSSSQRSSRPVPGTFVFNHGWIYSFCQSFCIALNKSPNHGFFASL